MEYALTYTRRSHESNERTVSLVKQFEACEQYVREQGWFLAAHIRHDGRSGGDLTRFQDIDQAVWKHRITRIVVYNADRLARDTEAFLHWVREWARHGIEVHVVGRGKIEIDTAAGFLTNGIESLIAEHYRRVTGEKTKDALAKLKANGKRYSRWSPFGYTYENGELVEHEGEQQIILKIIKLSVNRSLRKLSEDLARQGICARNGRAFAPSTLKKIIERQA